MSILTLDEKKYLIRICNLLKSAGQTDGEIEVYSWPTDKLKSINKISDFFRYDNLEVPEKLKLIIQKVHNHAAKRNVIFPDELTDSNDLQLIFSIESINKIISYIGEYSYYQESNEESSEFSAEDDPAVKGVFDHLEESVELRNYDELILNYDGSGDSGAINEDFDNGVRVPDTVMKWCYDELENNFGGWENDAGSKGSFIFDMKKKTISLGNTFYDHVSDTMELYSENFDITK